MGTSYEKYLKAVEMLDFVDSTESADSKVKAVLGTLASRLHDREARMLIEHLPEPLTYERLVGHRVSITDITTEQFIRDIQQQFRLDEDEAILLIDTVLGVAKEDLDEETLREIENSLPEDWARLIKEA